MASRAHLLVLVADIAFVGNHRHRQYLGSADRYPAMIAVVHDFHQVINYNPTCYNVDGVLDVPWAIGRVITSILPSAV